MHDPKKPAHNSVDPTPLVSDAAETGAWSPGQKGASGSASPDDLRFLSPPQEIDELGRLGGYRILRVLGRGGMGMVLEADDVRLKRRIAIKVMLPEIAKRLDHRERFLREAQAAAAVEHDHIVPILQVGEENEVPFIAMPFLKGEPLDKRLKRGGLHVPDILMIGQQTAEGLAVAHEHGLIHRDIKPANLWMEEMRGGACRVRILDFGLARSAGDEGRLTQSGMVVGTPAYMAPEQAAGNLADHRADLFSLGAVLYELATGRLPFRGKNAIEIFFSLANHTPPEPLALNPKLPPDLSPLIMKLLEKDPAKRPSSAQDAAAVLKSMRLETEFAGTKISPTIAKTATIHSRSSFRKWVLSASLLFIAFLGVGIYQSLPNQREKVAESEVKNEEMKQLAVLPKKNEPKDIAELVSPKKDGPIGVKTEDPGPPPVVEGDEITFDLGNGVKLDVIKITAKGKTFMMGSPKDEKGRLNPKNFDPEELHEVTFGHNFYIGKYEVTPRAVPGD